MTTRSSPSTSSEQPDSGREKRKRRRKYKRAAVRHFLFTIGPDRLTGGRMRQRHMQADIVVREVELASPRWPQELDGLRIGHISDFHLGDLLDVEAAMRLVERLAAQEPELVACTGDVVDLKCRGCEPLLQGLAKIDAPLGSHLVLGNHDELASGRMIARLAERAGMHVLQNDSLIINRNGTELHVAGTKWSRKTAQCSQFVDLACDAQTHLLLSHNPKSFRRAVQLGVPLTLAGHTHGGQVAMKKRPNTNLALTERFSAGPFTHEGSNLFVTSGVGAWFPLRVNCPAEIALITMRHGPVESARDHNPFVERLRDRIARRLKKRRDRRAEGDTASNA